MGEQVYSTRRMMKLNKLIMPFFNLRQSLPIIVNIRSFHISITIKMQNISRKTKIFCLGFKPWTAGWWMLINPLAMSLYSLMVSSAIISLSYKSRQCPKYFCILQYLSMREKNMKRFCRCQVK